VRRRRERLRYDQEGVAGGLVRMILPGALDGIDDEVLQAVLAGDDLEVVSLRLCIGRHGGYRRLEKMQTRSLELARSGNSQ
jgi:hypothetical protein